MPHAKAYAFRTRMALGTLFVSIAFLLFLGALYLPFAFEPSTILYKFGLEKTMLRAGHVTGVAAAYLLLFQLTLSSRSKILDRIFAVNRLLTCLRRMRSEK